MDTTDTQIDVKGLAHDVQYFNNVFKKAEKIASVLFYILSFKKDKEKDSLLLQSISKKSFYLHEMSLKTLEQYETDTDSLRQLQYAIVSLSSTVQVAVTGRDIAQDIGAVIIEQLDAVNRYLTNHYLSDAGVSIADLSEVAVETTKTGFLSVSNTRSGAAATPKQTRQRRVQVPAGDISSDAYMVYSQLTDRAERIKTVLEAKPQATIKDVAEIITDVSEKTIQRELNSLIEKGQVVREGERRWSRYSVVK